MRSAFSFTLLTFILSINGITSIPVSADNHITDTKLTPECISQLVNNNTCNNCIHLVQDFENNKEKFNNTVTEILEDIKMVCKNISTPGAKECVFVINAIERFDNVIFNSTSPRVVCEMAHLC